MTSDKKMYLVDEDTLLRLLEKQLELNHLEAIGVDNWTWYGEGREEFLLEAVAGRVSEEDIDSDIDYEYVAKLDLKNFQTCKASSIDRCKVDIYEDDLK